MFFGIIEKLMVSQVSTGLTLKTDYRKTYFSGSRKSAGRFCFVELLGSAAKSRAPSFSQDQFSKLNNSEEKQWISFSKSPKEDLMLKPR